MPSHGNVSIPLSLYSRLCSTIGQQHYTCDCTNFDETSKSGIITCTYPLRCVGCSDYCFSGNLTTTFAPGGNSSTLYVCDNITSPYEVGTCALLLATRNKSCVYKINGVACNFCIFTYFDYTNIPNGLKGAIGKSLFPFRFLSK